jgi:predicted nucleotidyltransferase
MSAALKLPHDTLEQFCKRHAIVKLAFFGSVLRPGDFAPTSDVDILVEFRSDAVPGLMAFARMRDELSVLLGGRPVDLLTFQGLSPLIADRVLDEAEIQYAEGQ